MQASLNGAAVDGITEFPPSMIVCSCNVLSDDDVRAAVSSAAHLPRTARQVYGCLGCSAECGRCARTLKRIMTEALGACARECRAGCPHEHAAAGRDHATTGAAQAL